MNLKIVGVIGMLCFAGSLFAHNVKMKKEVMVAVRSLGRCCETDKVLSCGIQIQVHIVLITENVCISHILG